MEWRRVVWRHTRYKLYQIVSAVWPFEHLLHACQPNICLMIYIPISNYCHQYYYDGKHNMVVAWWMMHTMLQRILLVWMRFLIRDHKSLLTSIVHQGTLLNALNHDDLLIHDDILCQSNPILSHHISYIIEKERSEWAYPKINSESKVCKTSIAISDGWTTYYLMIHPSACRMIVDDWFAGWLHGRNSTDQVVLHLYHPLQVRVVELP